MEQSRPACSYPAFHEISDAVDDPFWKVHFATMATGTMPFKNFYFKGGSILYKTKKKSQHLEIPKENAYETLKEFFRSNDGIMSDTGREATKGAPTRKLLDIRQLPGMTQTFVYNHLTKKYNLDPEEQLYLAVNIPLAFSTGLLQHKDVVIDPETATIVSIDGLDEDYFIKHRRWGDINPDLQTNKSSKRSIRSDTRMA